jgi:hypothetical protein
MTKTSVREVARAATSCTEVFVFLRPAGTAVNGGSVTVTRVGRGGGSCGQWAFSYASRTVVDTRPRSLTS